MELKKENTKASSMKKKKYAAVAWNEMTKKWIPETHLKITWGYHFTILNWRKWKKYKATQTDLNFKAYKKIG